MPRVPPVVALRTWSASSFAQHENANAPGRVARGVQEFDTGGADGARSLHPGARPGAFSGGELLNCGRLGHRPSVSNRPSEGALGSSTLLLHPGLGKGAGHDPQGFADVRQGTVKPLKRKGYLTDTMISTRRLRALPAAVLSSAIGDDSPNPADCIRAFGTPPPANASRTALARRADSAWLAAASPCPSVWPSIFTRGAGPAWR